MSIDWHCFWYGVLAWGWTQLLFAFSPWIIFPYCKDNLQFRFKKHFSQLHSPLSILMYAVTGACFYFLITSTIPFFTSYFLLFSALAISIKTDCDYFIISRFFSLFLIPLVWAASCFGYTPISLHESIAAALCGYLLFYVIAWLCKYLTGEDGLGEGDWELIAFIGSFLGFSGLFFTISMGAALGAVVGGCYLLITKPAHRHIPFGSYLGIAAMIYVLWNHYVSLPLF